MKAGGGHLQRRAAETSISGNIAVALRAALVELLGYLLVVDLLVNLFRGHVVLVLGTKAQE